MFTILNGLAGFASIHFATKDALGAASLLNLQIAAWLIFAAMVFDMLDGRIARVTRRTSEFGAQLDSLCDMVSFGLAPAMLMVRTVTMVLRGHVDRIDLLWSGPTVERVIWCVAGVYVACAALRLARFNVETDSDEQSHLYFRGLPTPGAAAAVAAMVLLFADLVPREQGWRSSTWVLAAVNITLPVMTLAVAFLMVSRIQYSHVINQYLRSKKPFGFLVKLVIVLIGSILLFFITAAAMTLAYVVSGPLQALRRRVQRGRLPQQPAQAGPPA
jgi:CDP-diacylglycerol--serine O-phosphatidyltransferase